MQLTDAQRQQIAAWVESGAKLSEIQDRLAREWGLHLTYMEVRLLVDDLKLTLKDPEPPAASTPDRPSATQPAPAQSAAAAPGQVTVTVDELARPGALVSGKVTFSDGQRADWFLDQMGRLGFVPEQQGYRPTTTDAQRFQIALENELARMGY